MLRPLLLSETYPPDRGGMAQSCDRIVRGLRARSLALDVVHLSRRFSGVRCEHQEGGRRIDCAVDDDPGHALNLLWNALQSERKPSHVIAFGGLLPMLAAPVFAAWWQLPLVVLLRGNDFDTGVLSLRRGWVLREALARAQRICVVSREQQRRVAALYPAASVQHIANGIDTRDWQWHAFDHQRAQAWRQQSVQASRRVLGVFGQLKQKKGLPLLLDALQRGGLTQCFHLLLIGDIEAGVLQRLQADPDLHWTHQPFVDRFELLPWYAACDLLALPSHYDGLPNVALEAGALGLPLLASRAGGLADLLPAASDDADSLSFEAGDLAQCIAALQRAARLPAAAIAELGRRLQATVLAQFDHRSEAARYHELLLDCRAPSCSGDAAIVAGEPTQTSPLRSL